MSRSSEVIDCSRAFFAYLIMRGTPINRSIWTCRQSKQSVEKCHEVMNVWRYEEWAGNLRMSRATGTVPERVQSRVHTTEPTGPVPEPFHCDHIARWSARSGTTGRSGTGVNTGARLRSGTVPVPNVWCEGRRVGKGVIIVTSAAPGKHSSQTLGGDFSRYLKHFGTATWFPSYIGFIANYPIKNVIMIDDSYQNPCTQNNSQTSLLRTRSMTIDSG